MGDSRRPAAGRASVIIVSHNHREHLARCLASLEAATVANSEPEITVVEMPTRAVYRDKPDRPAVAHGLLVLGCILRLVGQYRPLFFFGLGWLGRDHLLAHTPAAHGLCVE